GKDLAKANEGMRIGKIVIQRQRMLALGDPLDGALRQDLYVAEKRMAAGWSGNDDSARVSFASAAAKAAAGSATNEFPPSAMSAAADPTSASTLSGSAASARS